MKSGRPLKYDEVLMSLQDEALYTPADIADLAMAMGIGRELPEVDAKLMRTRIRMTMGRYGKNHHFPTEGDGMVQRRGQAPTPAWRGRRGKEKAGRLRNQPGQAH